MVGEERRHLRVQLMPVVPARGHEDSRVGHLDPYADGRTDEWNERIVRRQSEVERAADEPTAWGASDRTSSGPDRAGPAPSHRAGRPPAGRSTRPTSTPRPNGVRPPPASSASPRPPPVGAAPRPATARRWAGPAARLTPSLTMSTTPPRRRREYRKPRRHRLEGDEPEPLARARRENEEVGVLVERGKVVVRDVPHDADARITRGQPLNVLDLGAGPSDHQLRPCAQPRQPPGLHRGSRRRSAGPGAAR